MRRRLLVALLAMLALTAFAPVPFPRTDQNIASLQGKWRLVEMKFMGNLMMFRRLQLTVEKNSMTLVRAGNNNHWTYKLGGSGKCKRIDRTAEDQKTTKGIYTLDKDQLTIAFPIDEGGPRPMAFDDKHVLTMVFKREKN